MWGLFGKYASRMDYRPYNNFTCANPPPLPMVNVGPRGEYNRDWVKPGAKMLDFGGYEKPGVLLYVYTYIYIYIYIYIYANVNQKN